MTTTTPPKETMQSLNTLVSPTLSTLSKPEIIKLLNHHKHQLLSHIHSTSQPTTSQILYRSTLPTTQSYPKPTLAETQWLHTHNLPIPNHLAALHLRDYLHATYPTNVHSVLHAPSLMSYASPHAVLHFARDEVQAAYHVLSTVLTNSKHSHFAQFLQSNAPDIRSAILNAVNAILSPTQPAPQSHIGPDPLTVLSLLLSATLSNFLSLQHLLPILNTYITATSVPSHYALRALENHPFSIHLLTAAFTTAIRQYSHTLTSILDSFRPLLAHNSTLPALVSLSLASALRLTHLNPTADTSIPQSHPSQQFMTHALSSDALGKLRFLLHQPLRPTNTRSAKLMFRALAEDLLSFLSAFPPTSLDHSHVEDLANLVSGLMSRSEVAPLADVANSLWDDGDKSPIAIGVESVLHLSAAIYPLSFSPLISLLRVLAVDKRSAAHALNFLEHRMMTMCEAADAYSDALIALDEDQDVIWDRLRSYSRDREHRTTRALGKLKLGGNTVFVQAMRDIPGVTYRGDLPAGAVGISDENFTTVAWVHSWNGFNAVVYALDTLHDILCSDVPPSQDFHAVLEDLVDSAVEALGLIQKLCLNGSDTLRRHLCESFGVAETITHIVAEILQVKTKANFPLEWLQALLKSASSCLPAIVRTDAKLAGRMASILSDTVKRDTFTAVVSSFGEVAPLVLSAFSYVTSLLREETCHWIPGDEMMDCTDSDEGADLFKEAVSNILCSGMLTKSNTAVSSEGISASGWLLQLWIMRLFQRKPELLLYSSSATALFATTMVRTVSQLPLSESDCLLYPAVCESVTACVNALRYKSKCLSSSESRTGRLKDPGRSNRGSEVTALEEMMLRPDIVEALTMICCGEAKLLQNDRFYSGWVDSENRYLLPIQDRTLDYQPYDVLLRNKISNHESTADLWLSGMVTRCLSLQMDCLSHLGTRDDIPQLPWPSSSPTLDTDQCVGAVVREKIAKRISSGYGEDLLRLLVAVLSCRQRAASRSLFGPRPSSMRRYKTTCIPEDSHQKTGNEDEESIRKEEAADPIPAVISCLRRTFHRYQETLINRETAGSDEKLQALKRSGQLSTLTAICVRTLRLGLVSQNSRWFRDYVQSDFWELLTSLVRCGAGGNESDSFDLKRTTHVWSAKNTASIRDILGLDSQRYLLLNAEHILDIGSIWKGIAADVFHIASKELLADATEALLTVRGEKDESENSYSLPDSLFRRPLFRSFANVFSETWVTVLLGTELVREAMDHPDFTTESQDMKRSKAVPTLQQLVQCLSKRIMETATGPPSDFEVLSQFDRCGDLAAPYGASYAFDVERLRRFLDSKRTSEEVTNDLILAVMDLNMTIGRQDVYVEVLSSFSSMASIVLFVDSLCPTRTLELSYSSPQFGGKLCRYLPMVVTSLLSSGVLSWHFVAVSLEVSKLLSMLSTRLTKEELEQCALTSMRHGDALEVPAELNLSTPLAHICHVINRIVSIENTAVWSPKDSRSRHQIISWLLLTASRYTNGSAFHSTTDLQSLVRSCVRTLKMVKGTSEVCTAVATAMTETIANMPNDFFCVTFTKSVLAVLLSAVDATANQFMLSDHRSHGTAIAGLLFTVTRAVIRQRDAGNSDVLISLRDINASGVQPLLSTNEKEAETYDLEHDERNVYHTLWCSFLQIAAVAFPRGVDLDKTEMVESDDMRHVVEFCSMHLDRIVEDSLDMQSCRGQVSEGMPPHAHLNLHAVTMGKVEEAELGAIVLARLAPFGLVLQNAMPRTMQRALEQLCRYTAQATRILRTDPVERWVRPVTQRERERSGVAMEHLMSAGGALPNGQSTPNRSPSPGRRSRSQLTPKRSPSQALRAALSGKPRQGALTPSPGSSLTPLMSPMPYTKEVRGNPPCLSPNSPWGAHGSGLITRTGQCFAEEVSMSLIRGLCAALDAIRQLSEDLGVYPFQPTMEAVGDAPGIGTLLAILKFACWELNREGDESRRVCVQGIADTAMHLTLSHAMTHAETGALSQSVRDEVRKRVTTTLYRANNLVPPIPASSILRDEGLMSLWKRF